MPALPHNTPVFSVDNAAWTPMLTDPDSPGTATYGTKIDVPGIQEVSLDPDILAKELFGNNAIIARMAKARGFAFKVMGAKLSLDLLASILGGTVTDAGTTPAQTTTYDHTVSDSAKYGKLEYRVLGVELPGPAGGGDLHFIGWKCKLTGTSLNAKSEDFSPHGWDVYAIPRNSDGKDIRIIENETAVALA